MKHFNLKLAGAIIFSLFSISVFAQFDWHQGGNGLFPPPASVAIPANQLLGTTVNYPLRIITNNTERIHINENTPTTPGFVGIGTTNPQSQLHINDGQYATFQMTNATTPASITKCNLWFEEIKKLT